MEKKSPESGRSNGSGKNIVNGEKIRENGGKSSGN